MFRGTFRQYHGCLDRRVRQHTTLLLTVATRDSCDEAIESDEQVHLGMLRNRTPLPPRFGHGKCHCVIHRRDLARNAQHDRAVVFAQGEPEHFDPTAGCGDLVANNLITRTNDFEAITRGDVRARFDLHLILRAGPVRWLKRAIERNPEFVRRGGPRRDGLRQIAPCVAYFEDASFATGTCAPIGWTAMTRDEQIAIWRDARIDRKKPEAGDELVLR